MVKHFVISAPYSKVTLKHFKRNHVFLEWQKSGTANCLYLNHTLGNTNSAEVEINLEPTVQPLRVVQPEEEEEEITSFQPHQAD